MQLQKEIKDDIGISPTITSISQDNDNVTISFDSTLSGPEQITLNNLVSAHTPITSGNKTTGTNDLFSTTISSYTTRDTLTTEYLSAGDYKIDWFYTFRTYNGYPDIRIIIDNNTIIHTNNSRVPVISSTIEYDKTGFDIQTLTEGQHVIELQIKGHSDSPASILKSCLFISEVN